MNDHHFFCCEDDTVYGYAHYSENCDDYDYGQLGVNICGQFVHSINLNLKYVDIALGDSHTLLLTDKKKLYVCGRNEDGEIGFEKSIIRQAKPIKIMDNVKLVACGNCHSMVYTYDGKLYGFGCNIYGQLLLSSCANIYEPKIIMENVNLKKIWCGGTFSLVLDEDNNLFGFGCNRHYELGMPSRLIINNRLLFDFFETNEIKKVVCGFDFLLILTNSSELYVCGNNENGEIGLTIKSSSNMLQLLKLPFHHSKIKDICCGRFYSSILTHDGNVYLNGSFYSGFEIKSTKIICTDTKYFSAGSQNIILFQNDNTIISMSNEKEEIKIDKKIKMINNKIISWMPEYHNNLDQKFKDSIITFMMIYDRFKKLKCPIGKYVIFNIIKYVYGVGFM